MFGWFFFLLRGDKTIQNLRNDKFRAGVNFGNLMEFGYVRTPGMLKLWLGPEKAT